MFNAIYNNFKRYGSESLSNHELLTLILGDDRQADKVRRRFRSFREIAKENFQSISVQADIGLKEAEMLNLCFEIGRRYNTEKGTHQVDISSPDLAAAYLSPFLRDRRQECFVVLFLNNARNLESHLTLSVGTSTATLVEVKKIVKEAIVREADSIVVGHNHPSGTLRPSLADKKLTANIQEALKMVNITIDDHIIIAGDSYVSFRKESLM